jgi:16S rRNA processing protein RimM
LAGTGGVDVPADLVVVGHVVDAWRLDGGLKVAPYSSDAAALLAARTWWLDVRGDLKAFDVHDAKTHGSHVTARLVGIADRTGAEGLKGARISVERRAFPVTDDNAYYWVDLIGLAVVNREGDAFGAVVDLIETGAHQVLVVREDAGEGGDGHGESAKPVERLIPFVDAYVGTVDLAGRRIVVDWQKDY